MNVKLIDVKQTNKYTHQNQQQNFTSQIWSRCIFHASEVL